MSTTASPLAWNIPYTGDRTCPKFRVFTMSFTRGSWAAIALTRSTVPSREALSTKMCS